MKLKNIKNLSILMFAVVALASCSKSSIMEDISVDFSGTFVQKDQMGRPAINTVFVNSDKKDAFNTTIPSEQGAAFQTMFETNLKALSPAYANAGDKNAEISSLSIPTIEISSGTRIFNSFNALIAPKAK